MILKNILEEFITTQAAQLYPKMLTMQYFLPDGDKLKMKKNTGF